MRRVQPPDELVASHRRHCGRIADRFARRGEPTGIQTPEDIGRIAYVSAATISHRGTRVAFVVTRLDVPQNRYRRNLWLVNADGTGLMQLTRGDGDLEPQWSPDDRTIAFTGTRR